MEAVTLHPLTVAQMLVQELVDPALKTVQLLVQRDTVEAEQLEVELETVVILPVMLHPVEVFVEVSHVVVILDAVMVGAQLTVTS